jgi:hypothetical protein
MFQYNKEEKAHVLELVNVGEEGAKVRKLYVKNIDMKSKQDMWEEEIRQCCAG